MFGTFKFLSRNPAKLIICTGVLLLLGACQSTSPTTELSAHKSIQSPEQVPEIKIQTQLTAELLYDFLVASIASQRNMPIVALEALSSVAYQSKDSRIFPVAIRLALDLEAYQQAIALAQFFNRLEPDNEQTILALAKVQFKLGQTQAAITLLIDLVKNQTHPDDLPNDLPDDLPDESPDVLPDVLVFQEVAVLLSTQAQETVLPEFLKYVEKNPDNEQLTLTAALLASNLGNADEFIRLLDKTLELKSDWEFVGILKLSDLFNRDPDNLTNFAKRYLKANPKQEKFRLQYAQLLIQQDDIDSALDHLKKILTFNPNSTNALFALGIIYLDKDLLPQSKKALERYLELNLKNESSQQTTDQSRIYLAGIELELEDYAAAMLYLNNVSSPRYYLDAQVKIAEVIAQRDDIDSAVTHLQQISTENDTQRIRIILEQDSLLRNYEQLERSLLVLNEGLEEFPAHPDILYHRGLLAAQMELFELHEQDMRQLIELQPDNAHAYNALGYTLADQTDRLDEAMDLIAKANELLPDNGFILDSMGWVYFRLGHNEQAIKFLRQALEVRQDAEIAAHLGEVLWVTGYKDEARKIWQQGTEWNPENSILKQTIDRFSQQQSSYFAPDYWHTEYLVCRV